MNINLLPNQFIRNRASELIFLVAIIVTLLVVTICGLSFWFYFIQVNNYQSSITSTQAERIVLQRQLEDLSDAKSQELQQFVIDLKQQKYFTAPVMEALEEAAASINVTIISYDLLLNDDRAAGDIAEDGTSLFPHVSMVVQGGVYDHLVHVKEAFEEIPWVHHVTYQSFTHGTLPNQGLVTVYLSKNNAPQIEVENEEETDD